MWRFKVLLSFVLVLCAWTPIVQASQHDYVIDNAPGATVRADINSSLQAIVTNNAGATEPATTYPNMWWYDTSTSTLKRRNNADDAWITMGLEAASTDGTFAANSDSLVPTQKAAKTYADTKISKSTVAEIYNVTEKTTPAANDVLLLEDSAASYAKKSVKISNIRQSIDTILPTQTGNSGKFLTTNGSAASWGSVSVLPTYNYDSSSVIASANTERTSNSSTYEKVKEITLYGSGNLSFSFELAGGVYPNSSYAKIYRNGTAVGAEKSGELTSYVEHTDSVSGWSNGDKIQLYLRRNGSSITAKVKNFKVYGTQSTKDID